jgi:hypothetical protein
VGCLGRKERVQIIWEAGWKRWCPMVKEEKSSLPMRKIVQ